MFLSNIKPSRFSNLVGKLQKLPSESLFLCDTSVSVSPLLGYCFIPGQGGGGGGVTVGFLL